MAIYEGPYPGAENALLDSHRQERLRDLEKLKGKAVSERHADEIERIWQAVRDFQ
jgi:hypothetical protein